MTKLKYFAWVRERIGMSEEMIDLPGDASFHHPLKRAIDRRAAERSVRGCGARRCIAVEEIDEVVGRELPLLTQEHIDDQIPLAGPPLGRAWRGLGGRRGRAVGRLGVRSRSGEP